MYVLFGRDSAYHVRRKIQDPLPNLGISQAYMITTITIAKTPHPKGLVLSSNLGILKTEACMIRAVTSRIPRGIDKAEPLHK
jgi:hypothetical protein